MPPNHNRRSTKLPAHIDPSKLPTGVWYHPKGNGRWMHDYKDESTGKKKARRLCGAQATLSQIHQAVEAYDKVTVTTFKSLSNDFQKSIKWRELSYLTQTDYLFCHKKICQTDTQKGLSFGDVPLSTWTTGTVLKYRDFRGEESKSRANKELAYIKRVLAWAKLYEKITVNPADGVPKLTIRPDHHYVEDKDFNFLLQVAKESNYWYMPLLIRLSYECKLRLCEALDLTDDSEKPEGLRIVGRKGSNTNIIKWGVELRQAWDEAKAKRNQIIIDRNLPSQINPDRRWLFVSDRTGDRLTDGAVKNAKSKIDKIAKAKATRLGIEYRHFTLHSIKRKGVSDHAGTSSQKMDASRHKSIGMMRVYDVKEKIVSPTSEN